MKEPNPPARASLSQHPTVVSLAAFLVLALMNVMMPARAHAVDSVSFKTVNLATAGVSLHYPRGWIVFARTKNGIISQEQRLSKRNPQLGQAFRADVVEALIPTTKFHASDLGVANAEGLASEVRVQLVGGGFPSTLENFTSVREPGVERSGGTVLNASTVRISGTTSYRLDVSLPVPRPDGTVVKTRLGQLLVRRGGGRVVVTVSAPDDDTGSKLIDDVLGSVRRT